jgi:hypothetical protein
MFAAAFRIMLLGVPYWILLAMARFQLHRSCDPATARGYLIAGILVPFLIPLFIFLDRNKNLGIVETTYFDPPGQ